MKISTGIVRRVNELGRVVIPKEIRKTLGIETKDPIEITVEGSNIIDVFKMFKRNKQIK